MEKERVVHGLALINNSNNANKARQSIEPLPVFKKRECRYLSVHTNQLGCIT